MSSSLYECVCRELVYGILLLEELQQAAGVFKRSAKQLNNKTWWSSIIPTPSSFRSTKTAAAVPPSVVAAAQKSVTTNRSQMTSVRIEPSPPSASALKETAAIQSRTAETILRLQQQASASESIGAQILEELCSQGQTLVRIYILIWCFPSLINVVFLTIG